MEEYIVPDHEVEVITSDDQHINRDEVVPAVCYEVPLTYQPVEKGGSKSDHEPGEYVEEGGRGEESEESQMEVDAEELSDEKIFNMIPRTIHNPQSNKTTFLTHECVYVLVKWVFERRYNPFPTEAQKSQLSTLTKLPVPEIDIWLSIVRKSFVPTMIVKGALFINNYMKYHIENVKAQGRISVANFQNKRVILKKVGNVPVIIGKIQYSPQTAQKLQYVVPVKLQKVINNTVNSEIKEANKVNYESMVLPDSNYEDDIKSHHITFKSDKSSKHNSAKDTNVMTKKQIDMNAARCLMTWLFNFRDKPFPNVEQLRHISDVTGLAGVQVLRWLFTARKRILKKVRMSSTVLPPEMFKDCLTWHLNDLPGPKRIKQQMEAGQIPVVGGNNFNNDNNTPNHKKSPFKMDASLSGDDSLNDSQHDAFKKYQAKKMDRNSMSNKRLFIKSSGEELHPSETLSYSSPAAIKGASRKGKGNFPLSSKKVLMDWLFKNRHNPYPTDQEKLELSELSTLTLLQVNNWFINARRRFLDKMLKTGEECFLIKRQHKGFKELSKSYLRESGEVETEIVTYADEIMMQEENQQGTEIQITEYVCTDSADQSMVQYEEEIQMSTQYQMDQQPPEQHVPNNMIEVQVHLLPTKYEAEGSVVRVRCTEDEAVHVLKAVNSHPTVALNKIPDSESVTWEIIEEDAAEDVPEIISEEIPIEHVVTTEVTTSETV